MDWSTIPCTILAALAVLLLGRVVRAKPGRPAWEARFVKPFDGKPYVEIVDSDGFVLDQWGYVAGADRS